MTETSMSYLFLVYIYITFTLHVTSNGQSNRTGHSEINFPSLSEITKNLSDLCSNGTKINELTRTVMGETSTNASTDSLTTNLESDISPENLLVTLRKKGLYYDMPSVLHDINANKIKTGIIDLMHVHNRSEWITKTRLAYQAKDKIKSKRRMIFINVESVYNSKREMITKAVARRLRGRHMTTPPKFMRDIRTIIGPGTARRLYYSLTKYSTANHVRQVLSTHAVVLDRYWLHNAAFIIAKYFNNTDDLPPQGHPIYKWPSDLLVPDVLFFINATKYPHAIGFNQPYTDFTERLIQVFRRGEGVKMVELNPDKNFLSTAKYIVKYVQEHFKNHPEIYVPNYDVITNTQQNITANR